MTGLAFRFRPGFASLLLAFPVGFGLWACESTGATPGEDAGFLGNDHDAGGPDAESGFDAAVGFGLPVLHFADPVRANRGSTLLGSAGLGTRGLIPRVAVDNLWLVWGTGARGGQAWLAEMEIRYGAVPSPTPNDGLPLGFRLESGGQVSLNCLVCHAGRVAGEVTVGAPNSRFQLQAFYDDLRRLSELANMPVSYPVSPRTGAPGVSDAFGLGMALSKLYGPTADIHTEYGFQDPPPWWTLKYKTRIYTDGSGRAEGYRAMMATLLAFGMTFQEIQAKASDFGDLHQYLLSLEPPAWPFRALDETRRARGRQVFDRDCSGCHGLYDGVTPFPNRVIAAEEVETDPERSQNFGALEASWINSSWFGAEHPMESTGGYLAPVLVGVWASAPYFHNGSVPDLAGVLDSSLRPSRWIRAGATADDYDPERVGWRFVVSEVSVDARVGFDSSRLGLANTGHTFGDDLNPEERSELLEYLRGL